MIWTHLHYAITDLNNEIGSMARQITLSEAMGTNDRCQVLVNGFDNKTKVTQVYVLTLINYWNCDLVP